MRACPKCFSVYVTDAEFCGIDGARLEATLEDPLIGQTIDRYRVIELVGRGAMGSVYRVRHEVLDRDFALKVLLGEFATDRTLVARFRREAQALSRVRHHNVVSVIDFGTTEAGLTYLVMDFVNGPSLAEILDRGAALEPIRAASLARQVALGLAEAHALGLVHRDVKPGNILLDEVGGAETVRLVDFGIVSFDDSHESTKLTGVGKIVGTPTYMAPEQARGGAVTSSADLYALGVIFYQMLSGRVPFEGQGIAEVLVRHASETPSPLASNVGLEPLVLGLLAKQPELRPANAVEVASQLDAWLQTASADPSSSGAPTVQAASEASDPAREASEGAQEAALGTMGGSAEIDEAIAAIRGPWRFVWAPLALVVVGALVLSYGRDKAPAEESEATPPALARAIEESSAMAEPPAAAEAPGEAAESESGTNEPTSEAVDEETTEEPSESVRALPRLERRLKQVIEGRGLTTSDLDYFASTVALLGRLERGKAEGRAGDAALHAAELLDAVHTLPLSRRFLRWKVDRLAARLRGADISPADRKALEQRRIALRREIPNHPEPEAAEAIALKITRFERELDRKLR